MGVWGAKGGGGQGCGHRGQALEELLGAAGWQDGRWRQAAGGGSRCPWAHLLAAVDANAGLRAGQPVGHIDAVHALELYDGSVDDALNGIGVLLSDGCPAAREPLGTAAGGGRGASHQQAQGQGHEAVHAGDG